MKNLKQFLASDLAQFSAAAIVALYFIIRAAIGLYFNL